MVEQVSVLFVLQRRPDNCIDRKVRTVLSSFSVRLSATLLNDYGHSLFIIDFDDGVVFVYLLFFFFFSFRFTQSASGVLRQREHIQGTASALFHTQPTIK